MSVAQHKLLHLKLAPERAEAGGIVARVASVRREQDRARGCKCFSVIVSDSRFNLRSNGIVATASVTGKFFPGLA